jgi:replicative DNA helicase
MDDKDIENFLETAEKEANTQPNRDEQLARIRDMWVNYRGDDEIVTSEDILNQLENEPEEETIKSGWANFDKFTEGFTYEQLIVLAAQEKSGKTAWAIQLVDRLRKENPCCFLFEQSPRSLIKQMKSRGQEIPFFYTPKTNVDNRFSWFEERAMEAMVKNGSRLFVIDNVDWLQKEFRKNERTDEAVKDLLLKLKGFCTRWQVVIILIAHVTKMPMEEIPQPDSIKDTAAFKQIADTVLILWRKTKTEKVEGTKAKAPYRTNETLIWIAENRRTGNTGYAQFVFQDGKYLEKVWDDNLDAVDSTNYHGSDW